jgi:hypothetical protein
MTKMGIVSEGKQGGGTLCAESKYLSAQGREIISSEN